MIKYTFPRLLLLLPVFSQCRSDYCDGNVIKIFSAADLRLSCNTSSTANSVWLKDFGNHLFVGESPANVRQIGNLQLDNNYSLVIVDALIENQGTYTCKMDGKVLTTYCVEVYVAPVLSIAIDDLISHDATDAFVGEKCHLECMANGSKPKTSLVWVVNGKAITENITETFSDNQNGTYNSVSKLTYLVEKNLTHVSCVTQEHFIDDATSVNTVIHGYVVPDLTLLYKGRPSPAIIYMALNKTHLLTCFAVASGHLANLTWLRNDHQLVENTKRFHAYSTVSNKGGYKTTSLTVEPNEIFPPLNISCTSFGESILLRRSRSVLVVVYQEPTVEISLDGVVVIGSTADVLLGSSHSIGCTVTGNHFDLLILTVDKNTEENNATITSEGNANVYNKGSTVSTGHTIEVDVLAISELTDVDCKAFSYLDTANVSNYIDLKTVAVPEVSFTFEGKLVLQKFLRVANGHMYTLECTATEARPKVQLTWLLDESIVQLGDTSFVTLTTKGKKNLWDSSINLHFYLEGTSAVITCLAVGESYLQRTNRTIAFLSLGKKGQLHIREAREPDLNLANLGSVMDGMCKTEVLERNEEWTSAHQSLPHKQSVSLPKLPNETITSAEVYYSSLKEGSLIRNVYTKREVCFVAQLNKGTFLTRWIGTINKSQGNKTCLFISLPSDDKKMKQEFHWDIYLQKLMELPDHVNVIKTEGICIDNANIYLLQEYKPVGSLDDLLRGFHQDDKSGTLLLSDVLELSLQVVKGMEFIITHGFLHPGLSAGKVLATEKRCCKLYYFCLKEDASRMVIDIKRKVTIPELPPEASARNEYTWSSDSWSTAECVWKMLTFGTNQNLEHTWEAQSQIYPSYVLESLMQSTSVECMDRPPLKDLREAISTWMIRQDMDIEEADLTSKSSHGSVGEDGYTPMEGNTVIEKD
ncbi:uncharacterized protein [Apostichopus japonicus]|uniref:uncharacterized protein isoform X2 n=1 Tax=Stichopus japonicus TaxID=307972 RepID=UPI003AB40942